MRKSSAHCTGESVRVIHVDHVCAYQGESTQVRWLWEQLQHILLVSLTIEMIIQNLVRVMALRKLSTHYKVSLSIKKIMSVTPKEKSCKTDTHSCEKSFQGTVKWVYQIDHIRVHTKEDYTIFPDQGVSYTCLYVLITLTQWFMYIYMYVSSRSFMSNPEILR